MTRSSEAITMRHNPERIAWITLSLAFVAFVVLAISVPWAVRHYVLTAMQPQFARLEIIEGTAQLDDPALGVAVGVRPDDKPVQVREGSRIRTDGTSRVFLRFFDNSGLTLATNTEIELAEMRVPRFSLSPEPGQLRLRVLRGRATVGVAVTVFRPVRFTVELPQGEVGLGDGSYELDVSDPQSELVAYLGAARITAAGKTVVVNTGERATVARDQPPNGPVPSARPLLVNGDFAEPLDQGWTIWTDQGGDAGTVDGTAERVDEGDREAVRLFRVGSEPLPGRGNHGEVGIRQTINKELPDLASSLTLQAEVKLVNQSLSGGGYLSSEYPLILRLIYEDVYGSRTEWLHGFYYQNRDGNPTRNGQLVPQNVWFPYTSPNLKELNPPPAKIIYLDIYASGWDYESLVSRVRLVVE
jgi:hypothetical protein